MNISIIIPVYNRPELLRRAVYSVLKQSYRNFELILIDDGSVDGTADVAIEYTNTTDEDIKLVQFKKNRGVSAARNAGIQSASGEWIALLDSDDEWESEKIEKQVEFHQHNPNLVISQCNERWIRNGKYVNKRKIHRKKSGRIFRESLKLCLISPSAVFFHKDLVNEIGFFDESFPVCEDYDYWLRVLRKYPVGLLDEPLLTRYGGHEDQLSSQYWGMDRWRVKAMEKHLNAEKMPENDRAALYKELINKLSVLYQGASKRKKPEARKYAEKLAQYEKALMTLTSETIVN
ncbi:MAG: glycosyltransferase [Candidatus Marinimicrobia bacterium]|nr:glycosyltransferase [Candidatus Neomarinimicrobiota bacterium]